MEIKYLEDLIVFSKTLNYSAAAKELFITQSALSQRIAKMEKELGFDLVTHGKNPRLTTAGSIFCAKLSSILEEYKGLERLCAEIGAEDAGPLRVLDFRTLLPISESLAKVSTESGIPLSFTPWEHALGQTELAVLDHMVDVSFACSPGDSTEWFKDIDPEKYGFVKLPLERCVVVVPGAHPLAARDGILLEDLKPYTIVLDNSPLHQRSEDAIRAVLTASGGEFNWQSAPYGSKELLLNMSPEYVAISFGTAAQSLSHALKGSLVSKPLEDVDLAICPYAVYRKKDAPSEKVSEFVRLWEREIGGEAESKG